MGLMRSEEETSQEAMIRTGHGTTDWFQIRKGVCQGCILSPCLFNLNAEYIMRNAGLAEAQTGKAAGQITKDHKKRYPLLRMPLFLPYVTIVLF